MMRVIERSIDNQGQWLLIPEPEVEGWWTSLELADDLIIALYRDHATSEQFHSDKFAGSEFGQPQATRRGRAREGADQFKTDLDLERLPSGKFDTNTGIMALGGFVYNILRWIGLEGLIGQHAPLRHPAKRRRLRTVMQELVYLAGKFYARGRAWWLRFGCHCPAFAAYRRVDERLRLVPG